MSEKLKKKMLKIISQRERYVIEMRSSEGVIKQRNGLVLFEAKRPTMEMLIGLNSVSEVSQAIMLHEIKESKKKFLRELEFCHTFVEVCFKKRRNRSDNEIIFVKLVGKNNEMMEVIVKNNQKNTSRKHSLFTNDMRVK